MGWKNKLVPIHSGQLSPINNWNVLDTTSQIKTVDCRTYIVSQSGESGPALSVLRPSTMKSHGDDVS